MSNGTLEGRLAVCSWSLGAKSPRELIDSLEKVGIKRVQLALYPIHEDKANWGNAKQELADAGVEVVSGMFGCVGEDYSTLETIRKTGGVVPDENWPKTWEVVEKVAPIAADMGLDLVTFHAGFLPHERTDPNFNKLLDRIAKIAERFGSHGISVGFETGQEAAPALKQFLDTLGRSNVGVNFDPANMILYASGDPIEAVTLLGSHLKQVHIKDGVKTEQPGTWGKEVPVGSGDVDWDAFLAALKDLNYNGDLVIEREAGATRIEDIKTAREVVLEKYPK